ncbi:MAG TPA: diaminopimelate decarboxylase [Polyangia bacterium]|nr:diaminopimelate decarboxylase [Polyangia bacterium]
MHHFEYKGDELFCEGVPLAKIAAEVGTPVYVYSHATLERHFKVFDGALGTHKHIICYSVKANSNLAVLRTLVAMGAGVDTVSRGEIFRALKVGADPKKIVFSGVGKREDEIAYGLEVGILAFNVESTSELHAIERVAGKLGKRAPISLRVNPDVDAETHPYISTGLKKNKFGIPVAEARKTFIEARGMKHIEVVGIDCHIGSQLTKTSPFKDAIARLGELARSLVKEGVSIRYVDIGGGLGIPYNQEDPPSPAEYGRAIEDAMSAFSGLDVTLICEPGRVIVGNAGVLLTKTLYLKQGEIKNFVIVDAAMNDLIRPAFYDSYHAIWPVKKAAAPASYVADVVGPICETGDFLARDRALAQKPAEGDLLALMSAGAYGFTMSSNYNTRPRAAEVMVKGNEYAVVRRREELEEMVRNEAVPSFVG